MWFRFRAKYVFLREDDRGKSLETNTSPVYPKQFFELQLIFAQKIADLSQQPLNEILLHYTAFYRILGLDWSLDPTNSVWQTYTQGLQQAAEKMDFTHQFYLQRYSAIPKFTDEEHWGCFSYEHLPEEARNSPSLWRPGHFHLWVTQPSSD